MPTSPRLIARRRGLWRWRQHGRLWSRPAFQIGGGAVERVLHLDVASVAVEIVLLVKAWSRHENSTDDSGGFSCLNDVEAGPDLRTKGGVAEKNLGGQASVFFGHEHRAAVFFDQIAT